MDIVSSLKIIDYLILKNISVHEKISRNSLRTNVDFNFKEYAFRRAIRVLHKEKHLIKQVLQPVILADNSVIIETYYSLTPDGEQALGEINGLIKAASQ